jgi:hypothetical protein
MNSSEPPKPYSFDIRNGDIYTFWCAECGYEDGEYIEDRGFVDNPHSCTQCGGGPLIKARKKPSG